jgi:hypothetical protein
VEVSKDGKRATSFSLKDGIAASVHMIMNERGEIEIQCNVMFVDEINQKTLQGRASDGS